MKVCLLLIISLFLINTSQGQPWTKNLPANKSPQEINFFDYQQAFNDYWDPYNVVRGFYELNGVKKKAAGWKQFKRWEHEMESLIDKKTGAFPKQTAIEIAKPYMTRSHVNASWTSLGPDNSRGGYGGIGRINCVAFHPTDVNTYWVGAAAGGLWMTTDNGTTWTCMTNQNGVLAVSDIVIMPDFDVSHTIYIATGDRDGWDNRSIGVLKSTDGGFVWNQTDLSFNISEGQMVNRLIQDPNNLTTLIAATTRGVFRTVDGGDKWDEELNSIEFIDMEFHPGNFNILYGSTKSGDIYTSINSGNEWTQSFHDDESGRVELAVSPNQPTWVYALASGGDSGLRGVWKSETSGSTFDQVFDRSTANLLTWAVDGNDGGGQGWYDLSMAASPLDANILLVGGVNTWRSLDGGVGWSIVSHWAGQDVQEVHADKHMLRFRSNGDVFECNDGGIYLSDNFGSSWTDKTNGIAISQMYKLGVSQTEYGDVITGLQDNGSKLWSGSEWYDVRGGDGMECLIDYSDADIQYSTLYYGRIDRTTNHWNNAEDISPPDAGDGAWVTPYIIDPELPSTLYAGYNEVWKTTDRGDNWSQISDLSAGQLQHLAIAPNNAQYLCAATYNRIY
ncbi:MAG: hypothetical protein M3R25_02165, partial [Bacteroidota bacterium]|nr:hypothetical protein [Bacteroidota bacterium]